jgi:folate-binding protein YgfZ
MAEPTPLHDVTTGAGAVFTEQAGWSVPAHFGDAAAEYKQTITGGAVFDRSPRGKVELTGPEASSFLHNLSTNDINNLPLGGGCEAFLTTNKAKLVSHLYVFHVQLFDGRPALWLDVQAGQAEAVIKHLDHFLISEQVEFADRTREFAQMHLAGPNAHAILERALLDDVPELEPLQHMVRTFGASDTCHVRCFDPLGVPGYDIVCLRARAESIWKLLVRAGASPAGEDAFAMLRVEAGTPVFGLDLDETTFAPEVGRTAEAISYHKGCYLGQEPIVMARDRGQVNRQLMGVRLPAGPVPHGSPLFRDGKEIGRVTTSLTSPRLGAIGLAYVRRGSQDPGTILEVESEGKRQVAEVATLPFVT